MCATAFRAEEDFRNSEVIIDISVPQLVIDLSDSDSQTSDEGSSSSSDSD